MQIQIQMGGGATNAAKYKQCVTYNVLITLYIYSEIIKANIYQDTHVKTS